MIDLTPLDVRKKKEDFKRAVRGYDAGQVDSFLDLVADRLEQLVREHSSLAQRVEGMREQLSTYQEREKALNEALLAAQELREEARSQAERDAAVRLREAETHAEAILLDADQAIRHSQRRLEDLRARRTQFLRSLRTVLDRFHDYVELEETRLESEPEDLGTLLEKLEGDIGPERLPGDRPLAGEPRADAGPAQRNGQTRAPAGDSGAPDSRLGAPAPAGGDGSSVANLDAG
ncbi:MAG: DivIVA domain-containing protein [Gemmatimonadota bacterium]